MSEGHGHPLVGLIVTIGCTNGVVVVVLLLVPIFMDTKLSGSYLKLGKVV